MTVEIKEDVHEDSHEARELHFHGDSDARLYHNSKVPVMKNLEKKHKKGTYDHEKAKKLWGHHADRVAQDYAKQHGHPGAKWHEMFSTKHRKEAAKGWADEHHAEMKSGNFHESVSDHASEIVYAAMANKPLDATQNFRSALFERSTINIEEKKSEMSGQFFEAWDNEAKIDPAKKGMWDGWSKEELEKARTTASGKRLKEINFALRAKSGWGKVPS